MGWDCVLELVGRGGELLLGRECLCGVCDASLCSSSLHRDCLRLLSSMACSLGVNEPTLISTWGPGELGAETARLSSGCTMFRRGLPLPVQTDVGEDWDLETRLRRLSISSSTMSINISAGSSMPARFSVRERSWSASRSQPKNCRKSML